MHPAPAFSCRWRKSTCPPGVSTVSENTARRGANHAPARKGGPRKANVKCCQLSAPGIAFTLRVWQRPSYSRCISHTLMPSSTAWST